VPLVRPVTVIGEAVPVAVIPPGDEVTVYDRMLDPPSPTGAVKLTVAFVSPAIAVPIVGASGTVRIAVPFSGMVWVALSAFRLLSVMVKVPLASLVDTGVYEMNSVQLDPAGTDVFDVHVELEPRLKPWVIVGLLPLASRSGSLPLFPSVTVLGLSELVVPTTVESKVTVGGVCAESSQTPEFGPPL
jgi:hypothetical protein